MDLDLSDDQVALRDGIASMLDGARSAATACAPASIARCSTSSPRPACSRCAPTASRGPTAWSCSSSSAGSACPARSSRRCCSATAGSPASSTRPRRSWIEHLDALDDVVVLAGRDALRASTASALDGRAVAVAARSAARRSRASTRCPAGDADRRRRGGAATRGRGAHRRVPARARPTGCTELAVAYAKERVQFDRPIGGVPGDQAPAAPTCSCAPRSRAPRCTPRARTSTTADALAGLDRRVSRREGARGRGRDRQRQGRDAGVRRHGLHVGGRRAPLPEAGVGARHALRLGRRARRRRRGMRSAPPSLTLLSGRHGDVRPQTTVLEALAQRLASDPDGPYLDFANTDGGSVAVHRARDGRGVDPARARARRRSASSTATASRRCSRTAPSRSSASSPR